MNTIDTAIDIQAPPNRVWGVLADVARWAEWNPFIRRFDGELRQGVRITVVVGAPGRRPLTFRPRLLAASPAEGIRWLGRLGVPGLFDGEHQIFVEPLPSGGTRVRHGERFTGLLVPFVRGMLRDTERGFIAMNQALKARVEAG